MELFKQQIEKINSGEYVVGVIGLGYVGLPLASLFLSKGFKVIGFDVDETKITKLQQGEKYIEHLDIHLLHEGCVSGKFLATVDYSLIEESDAIIICVPTPLDEHREPDLSFVVNSLKTILPYLKQGQLIALESTTYPGTTEEILKPNIEEQGFKVGEDIFLVYSPEREDPNNPNFTTKNIPKVCGGTSKNCSKVGAALYEKVIDNIVMVSSANAAEMTKILENTFRAVNIALVNELKVVAEKMGVDIFEVINAAATKPFGFMPFYPGPGLGGHCIPIDPFYLTWKAREYGVATKFIELAGEVNVEMPDYVIMKTADALNEIGLPLKGSRILLLGLAYKKNVDDPRESPSVVILDKLIKKGVLVDYSDPHIPSFPKMRKFSYDMTSVDVTAETLSEYDCVMVVTHHDRFDWELIRKHARLIVDTRGVYEVREGKIIRA